MNEPAKLPYELTVPVVLRYRDGRMLKCRARKQFSISLRTVQIINGEKVESVPLEELKAVFFVKSLEGLGHEGVPQEELPDSPKAGRLLSVTFSDGENVQGRCLNFSPEASGFILFPLDVEGNNERIFVIASATREIEFLED